MANVASVYETAAAEVRAARAAFAVKAAPYASQDWILRNVFKFTEDEISRCNPLDHFARQVFEGA
jgi:hypothetical protein